MPVVGKRVFDLGSRFVKRPGCRKPVSYLLASRSIGTIARRILFTFCVSLWFVSPPVVAAQLSNWGQIVYRNGLCLTVDGPNDGASVSLKPCARRSIENPDANYAQDWAFDDRHRLTARGGLCLAVESSQITNQIAPILALDCRRDDGQLWHFSRDGRIYSYNGVLCLAQLRTIDKAQKPLGVVFGTRLGRAKCTPPDVNAVKEWTFSVQPAGAWCGRNDVVDDYYDFGLNCVQGTTCKLRPLNLVYKYCLN